METSRIIKINGHYYLKVPQEIGKKFNNTELKLEFNDNAVTVHHSKDNFEQVEFFWNQAAVDFKREIFMNTIRPLLKEELGLEYTEIKCEEKAKLLCREYYLAAEKGEKYEGPYLL